MLLNHSRPSSKQVNRKSQTALPQYFKYGSPTGLFTCSGCLMLIACYTTERYGHVRAKRFRLSTSKTDGTHCSKTLKRCLKIFLIRSNKNKIVLLCFTLNFSHVIFLIFSGNDILFVMTSRVTQLFTRQTAIFRQN